MCIIVKFNEMQMRQLNWNILKFTYMRVLYSLYALRFSWKRKFASKMERKENNQQREGDRKKNPSSEIRAWVVVVVVLWPLHRQRKNQIKINTLWPHRVILPKNMSTTELLFNFYTFDGCACVDGHLFAVCFVKHGSIHIVTSILWSNISSCMFCT